MSAQPKVKIFSDFDGTITLYDTWIEMGERFIKNKEKWAEVIKNFEEQKIGARECFLAECALIEDFDKEEFDRIIDSQRLDPMFLQFVDFCSVRNLPLMILSEGMDYYIARILGNNGLDIPFYANKLVFSEDSHSIGLEFPNADSDCMMMKFLFLSAMVFLMHARSIMLILFLPKNHWHHIAGRIISHIMNTRHLVISKRSLNAYLRVKS